MKPYSEIISINPNVSGGKACVRNLRITVTEVLSYLASGMSSEEIVSDFSELNLEDVFACLAYAAESKKHVRYS